MVINKEMTTGDLSSFVLYTVTLWQGVMGTSHTLNGFVRAISISETVRFSVCSK